MCENDSYISFFFKLFLFIFFLTKQRIAELPVVLNLGHV